MKWKMITMKSLSEHKRNKLAVFAEDMKPRLLSFARKELGDVDLAYDAYQLALMDVLRKEETVDTFFKYDEKQRLSYLFKAVDWRCKMISRERNRKKVGSYYPLDERRDGTDTYYNPETTAVNTEHRAKLLEGMEQLTEKQKEAIQLVHIEGLTLRAAGRKAGVSDMAVFYRLESAYKKLGTNFGEIPEAVDPLPCPYCLKCKATNGHKPLVVK